MKSRILLIIIVAFFIGSCAYVYMNRQSFAFTKEAPVVEEKPAPEPPPAPKPEPPPAPAPEPEPLLDLKDPVIESELTTLLKQGMIPSYKMTLKELIDAAESRIRKIDKVLTARANEKLARQLIEEGDKLNREGKHAEAKEKYLEAKKTTADIWVRREANGRIRSIGRPAPRAQTYQYRTCSQTQAQRPSKPCTQNFTPKQ